MLGLKDTVVFADQLMYTGFAYATRAGVSIGIDDMIIPTRRRRILDEAETEVLEIQQQYQSGLVTAGERYNKVVDIWSRTNERVAKAMMDAIGTEKVTNAKGETVDQKSMNSIYIMADSGARGSQAQIRQLAGMRGLMAKPDGSIIETPITANFREGLNVLQYFISTHGARKGLADTALKTANSGYLTRRLVDVAQDVVVTETDCGTTAGLTMTPIVEGGDVVEPLRDRVLGRIVAEDVFLPGNDEDPIVTRNTLLDEALGGTSWKRPSVQTIQVRSPITCESASASARNCYGRDLGAWPHRQHRRGRRRHRRAVDRRARHPADDAYVPHRWRGIACGGDRQRHGQDHRLGQVQQPQDGPPRQAATWSRCRVPANCRCSTTTAASASATSCPTARSSTSRMATTIKAGQTVANWDPHTHPIVSEVAGFMRFVDFVDGVTVIEKTDELTGLASREITDPKRRGSQGKDLRPIVAHRRRRRARTSTSRAPTCRRSTCCRPARSSTCRTARRSASATSSPRSRRNRRRPATSPAVCRAWPTCSRRASRRNRRSWPRARGIGQLRQGHQGQAAPGDQADRTATSTRS